MDWVLPSIHAKVDFTVLLQRSLLVLDHKSYANFVQIVCRQQALQQNLPMCSSTHQEDRMEPPASPRKPRRQKDSPEAETAVPAKPQIPEPAPKSVPKPRPRKTSPQADSSSPGDVDVASVPQTAFP